MTLDQYMELIADIQLMWSQPIDDETADLWWKRGLFADLDYQDAHAAVMALSATSQWAPRPADIRRWVANRATAAVDTLWGEVWAEILEERDRPRPWSAATWSAGVAPFMEYLGLATLNSLNRGAETPVDMAQAQLRRKWEEWREREVDRIATDGIPAVQDFYRRRGPRALAAHYPRLGPALDDVAKRTELDS